MQLKIASVSLIILINCHFSQQTNGTRNVQSLRFIIVVSKHGARAPTHTYPRDPYKDRSMWPDGPGHLTKVGKQQMYRVGQTLRSMYDGHLSHFYQRTQIMMQATLVDRTMLSAATLLAGLYPPHDYQLWNPDIHWQPVPVYPNLLDKSLISLDPSHCPRYVKEQNTSLELLRDENSQYADIYEAISRGTGRNLTKCSQMYLLYNNFAAVTENGLPLPDWAEAIYIPRLLPVISRMVKDTTLKNAKMIRILNGLLIKKIVDLFKWRVHEDPSKAREELNAFLHVGHDITLLCLLSAVGLHDENIPSSSTTLIFELHHNTALPSKYQVQVLRIDGNVASVPRELDMPHCKTPCDFHTFLAQTQKYTTSNWEQECQDMTSPSDE